jgi:hypothetical protein
LRNPTQEQYHYIAALYPVTLKDIAQFAGYGPNIRKGSVLLITSVTSPE